MESRMSFLFALYDPDRDPENLPLRTLEGRNLLNDLRDKTNIRPKAEPPYSDTERSAVQDWRQRVEQQVTTRISSYRYKTSGDKSTLHYAEASDRRHALTEHRMLQIAELRSLILQFAGPVAQIRALRVSKSWRSSAFDIIRSRNTATTYQKSLPSSCNPVEHGKLIDEDVMAPLQPSSEETRELALSVERTCGKAHSGKRLYFPAKCAQRRDLPSPLAETLNHQDWSQRGDAFFRTVSVSRETDIYWLDLSQLEINPYLDALFAEEHQSIQRLGRWEICLRPEATPQTLLLNSFLSNPVLLDTLGSMHVTTPPCRALGIYHNDFWTTTPNGHNTLLTRIRNDQGVRIAELLDALRRFAPVLLETWFKNTERLVGEIRQAHWIDDIWTIPGAPTFRIYLDNVDMSDDAHLVGSNPSNPSGEEIEAFMTANPLVLGLSSHITRAAQMNAEPFRRSRERGWVSEDLLEPAESTTGRHPINWNV